jgi:hypothetical protein
MRELRLVLAAARRAYWRIIGTPREREEIWRRRSEEHVPLSAIREHLAREHEPAEVRVHREREAVSRELLELTRARHTAAVVMMSARKKEA